MLAMQQDTFQVVTLILLAIMLVILVVPFARR